MGTCMSTKTEEKHVDIDASFVFIVVVIIYVDASAPLTSNLSFEGKLLKAALM